LKHRYGKSNKVVDALSRRIALLNTFSIEVVGLKCVKEIYTEDSDFTAAWKACREPWSMNKTPYLDYHIQEGFLFRNH
jgi:regulator of sigma D